MQGFLNESLAFYCLLSQDSYYEGYDGAYQHNNVTLFDLEASAIYHVSDKHKHRRQNEKIINCVIAAQ